MNGCRLLAISLLAAIAASGETVYTPEDASRRERFANPPAGARILPMKHYRTTDPARVAADVRRYHDLGFGGMATEVAIDRRYLDDEKDWDVFRGEIAEMRRLGMTIWIYDELGYPSGTAGGRTLAGHPEWRARGWLVSPSNDFSIADTYLDEACLAPVHGTTRPKPYINILMKDPVARFIELTHERYARELGDALGAVTATFTDEPSLKSVWERDVPCAVIPVSDGLLAAYRTRSGHSLSNDVAAIVSGPAAGETAAKRHLFWSLIAERVAENYFGQLAAWTRRHGILSGGHLLNEESAQFHVGLYGDFFRAMRRLEAPGCDMLTSVPSSVGWCAPGLAGSAGELNGARRVMSESSDISDRRPGPDGKPRHLVTPREVVGAHNRQIAFGINTFTSYYRWELTGFTDDEIRSINLEIGRTVTLATEGRSAADIAILYPADALMVGYEPRPGAWKMGGPAARTGQLFREVGTWLTVMERQFMVTDAESIVEAEVRGDSLVRGPLAWHVIILPAVSTLPIAAAEKLAEFARQGGLVIALEGMPVNSTERFPDERLPALERDWLRFSREQHVDYRNTIRRRHVPPLRAARGGGPRLRHAHRHTAEGDVFFVFNDSEKPLDAAVIVGNGKDPVTVWDPRTVKASSPKTGEIALELPPWGGALLTTPARIEPSIRH